MFLWILNHIWILKSWWWKIHEFVHCRNNEHEFVVFVNGFDLAALQNTSDAGLNASGMVVASKVHSVVQ